MIVETSDLKPSSDSSDDSSSAGGGGGAGGFGGAFLIVGFGEGAVFGGAGFGRNTGFS
jgi:hypothetical protein